jgi:putative two-component system response regulator
MTAQILVVDDDPAVVSLVSRFLVREGYKVLTANNGAEAFEYIQRTPPDLILLDVVMPVMDGLSLCRRLKENPNTALIPITMLTGQDDYEHRKRGIEAGADDFLSKPFDQSILRARIQTQLRLKRLTDQLEQTENVILMLALVVEAKDEYTEGHLQRMRSYSEQLAIACGLSANEISAIRYSGLLHDIGKIGVSEAILRKSGPLTDEEFAQMAQHPILGQRIIAQMRFARDVGPIIRAHHERWDGKGYPDGLRGEAIPIGARLIAIVDAYDAMTTDRPYRTALSDAEVMQQLRAGSGTQFDPEILAVFLDMLADRALQVLPQERAVGDLLAL